ncbi:Predicted PurR-regulated permease PerM [Methanococcoides vulcani]|uniref:Predicted PurR-regulated permease PerM n=1 Tax=Methanococcoides vulcani TaxID=1353158 RepID=A0A1I0BEG8_9EURY|nr:AI-2E family transporter [Methanococcoides vulcani]SET04906.1 Predicted PurR-regulated permease PerM [Methanococcoides vulcani]
MRKERSVKMVLALLCIIILAIVLSYALLPYINAFLGAFILYVIFKPVYCLLTERFKLRKDASALSVMMMSIILVLIPLYFLFVSIVGELEIVISSIATNISYVDITENINYLNEIAPDLNIQEKVVNIASTVGSYTSRYLLSALQNISGQIISLTIMFFLLYYLFTSTNTGFDNKLREFVPFNNRNTEILLRELKNVIQSTLIATLLIALLQGALIGLTFYAVGIQGATLWGAVTAILSFLPVVGAPLVWIPAAIIQFALKNYVAGIAILVMGIIISNIDNVLRPLIQKKVGAMHPFVSLLGIFVGIYLFGIIGIVVGPLLISTFLLVLKMFNEEYLQE